MESTDPPQSRNPRTPNPLDPNSLESEITNTGSPPKCLTPAMPCIRKRRSCPKNKATEPQNSLNPKPRSPQVPRTSFVANSLCPEVAGPASSKHMPWEACHKAHGSQTLAPSPRVAGHPRSGDVYFFYTVLVLLPCLVMWLSQTPCSPSQAGPKPLHGRLTRTCAWVPRARCTKPGTRTRCFGTSL